MTNHRPLSLNAVRMQTAKCNEAMNNSELFIFSSDRNRPQENLLNGTELSLMVYFFSLAALLLLSNVFMI